MPWVDDFDEDDFEWPLYADVDVEELMDTSTNAVSYTHLTLPTILRV